MGPVPECTAFKMPRALSFQLITKAFTPCLISLMGYPRRMPPPTLTSCSPRINVPTTGSRKKGGATRNICPVCWTTIQGVNHWSGDCKWQKPLVRMKRKQKQIGSRQYTVSILRILRGFVWLQQSPCASLGKISEAHEVVLKHRPAHLSYHPSTHPSLLLDPLLPLIHIWN